ncbi:ABC transporter ATP-binding protein [Myxococcaceae bacterium GXIMD 01537]
MQDSRPEVAASPPRPSINRRIMGCLSPHRGRLVLLIGVIVLTVLLQTASPVLFKFFIDELLGGRDLPRLYLVGGLMLGAPILAGLVSLLQSHLSIRLGLDVMHDLRGQLFAHLQSLPLHFFTTTKAGEVQSRLGNDVNGIQERLSNVLVAVVSGLVTLVALLASMVVLEWRLTLFTLVVIPPLAVIANRFGAAGRKAAADAQATMADLSTQAQEGLSVSGILLGKTFGQQRRVAERFTRGSETLGRHQWRQQIMLVSTNAFIGAIFGVAPMAVFLWAIPRLVAGDPTLTLGTLVAFTQLQTRLFFKVVEVLREHVSYFSTVALFERIFEFLDLAPDIVDAPTAKALDAKEVRGHVRFRDVSFQYPAAEGAAAEPFGLKDVDFEVRPGQLVALVGPSGSGKTTAAYLLSRLYDVRAGAVEIDSVDVRALRQESLTRLLGVVSQDTFLLHDSVLENIRFGRPSATREEVEAAARAAAIHDRILAMPGGYDAIVGERGYKLSGGEKQRIGIARVLLRDPRVLVLDEATSALDSTSEREMQAALQRLMEGRTTLAIAHRLSTVQRADLILVMDQGRIVETGTHAELLQRGGLYARLHRDQFLPGEQQRLAG